MTCGKFIPRDSYAAKGVNRHADEFWRPDIECTNDPPRGPGVKFLTYEGLPSDHYLKMVGESGKLLRGESIP